MPRKGAFCSHCQGRGIPLKLVGNRVLVRCADCAYHWESRSKSVIRRYRARTRQTYEEEQADAIGYDEKRVFFGPEE